MKEYYRLSDICFYVKEKINSEELTNETYISTENMVSDCGGIETAASLPSNTNVSKFKEGDALFSNIRPYFRKVWLANRDGECSNDVIVFRPVNGIHPWLLYFIVSNPSFIKYVMAGANGAKMPRGDKAQILDYEIDANVIRNQNTIISILSPIERHIQLNKKINDNLAA